MWKFHNSVRSTGRKKVTGKKRAVMLTRKYCEHLMAVPVAAQCIVVK